MKKIIALCIAILMAVGLSACNTEQIPQNTVPASKPEAPKPQGPYLSYSPYAVNAFVRESMGEDYTLYCKMVDAVLSYDCEVSGFESESQSLSIWSTMRAEFPPAEKLCASAVNTSEPYIYSDGTARLQFLFEKEEHNRILETYAQRIQQDISVITEETTETEKIAQMYSRVVDSMVYEENGTVLYDCIMENSGICEQFAEYLMLLLNQIGVECYFAHSYGEGVEPHAWVIARMDGAYYHFDPTWGQLFPNWYWFGVGDALRRNSLMTEWKIAYMVGGDYASIKGDAVIMSGHIDWITQTKIPLPLCGESYKEGSRSENTQPWLW